MPIDYSILLDSPLYKTPSKEKPESPVTAVTFGSSYCRIPTAATSERNYP